ncbi:MAG: hypothetical protein SGPRY_009419 [Prymnesium sp.]
MNGQSGTELSAPAWQVYKRQITKHGLTSGVCDDEQVVKSFTKAELEDLWDIQPEPPMPSESELHPKHRLPHLNLRLQRDLPLRELLASSDVGAWVTDVISHDSLLELDAEGELTEQERQEAAAEYEAEQRAEEAKREAINAAAAHPQDTAGVLKAAKQYRAEETFHQTIPSHQPINRIPAPSHDSNAETKMHGAASGGQPTEPVFGGQFHG